MKKIILISSFICLNWVAGFAQSTATDFAVEDCDAVSRTLYSELDAGKVIVIAFVMPCGSCIGPALEAYNTAKDYESTNPGKVLFYLADDHGNTSCATLKPWATNNGMADAITISNADVNMSDYGTSGMPKIVVAGGGSSHEIFFNKNNSMTASELQTAIDEAMSSTTGIKENAALSIDMNMYPNPVIENAKLSYNLPNSADVKIEVYNMIGKKVKELTKTNQLLGKHEVDIDFESYANGVYFVKLNADGLSKTIRVNIAH